MRSLTLACVAGLFLAGCAPSAPPLAAVAPAQLPSGFLMADAPKFGISIGVPPGWKAGSGETVDLKTSIADMGGGDVPANADKGNDPMGKLLRDQEASSAKEEAQAMAALEAKGIVIRVNSTSVRATPGEAPTRYQVRIFPNPSGTLEGAANWDREPLYGEGKPEPISIPAGPCMVIKGDKKNTDGGEVFDSKYVLQDGKTMIVVTFVTEADSSVIRRIEKQVMDTLRIVPGKAVVPKDTSK